MVQTSGTAPDHSLEASSLPTIHDMKILVLSDIHANWPALSAIQESFDACLFLGDVVDYGTNPLPCIEWVRQHATCAIRGNHDHAVAQRVPARDGSGLRSLAAATRPFQFEFLDRLHLKYLSRLPITQRFNLDGRNYYLVHATPHDPMDEYLLPEQTTAWESRLRGIEADIVCVGHTHLQFLTEINGIQVLNPGSVGQPRDGDWRCAYAVIQDGEVQLRRVEYDVDATLRHMVEVGVDPQHILQAASMLRTGGRPSLYRPPPGGEIGQPPSTL